MAIALLGLLAIGTSALLGQLVDGTDRKRSELRAETRAVAVMESLLTREYAALPVGTGNGTGPLGVSWSVEIFQEQADLRRLRVVAVEDDRRSVVETLISNRFDGVP